MEEVNAVAKALFETFQPTKINYELLGNMVPHMHWHLVPRYTTDSLWPRPIWSEAHDPELQSVNEYASRMALIQSVLRFP
jgi:diadenosine tetraphosphate (Ap4A) HIT family hydrolase